MLDEELSCDAEIFEKALKKASTKTNKKESQSAPSDDSINKDLKVKRAPQSASSNQRELNLGISKAETIDGIEMGVLSDGTPFLTQNSLAEICGVARSSIQNITNEWSNQDSTAVQKIKSILNSNNYVYDQPYIKVKYQGQDIYAYSDIICSTFMQYYAFEAGRYCTEKSKQNFIKLATLSLRQLIYQALDYKQSDTVPAKWQHYHERLSLVHDSAPKGYFGIFKEIADLVLHLGQNGLYIDSNFVPDISIGITWSNYWQSKNLAEKYGERLDYPHNYPKSFAQSKSNPQHPFCYPEEALGVFRKWVREQYIGKGKMKKYLESKVKDETFSLEFVQLAIKALDNKKETN